MKIKTRRKSSRARGSHTHFRGFKKKARGSGHRGGFGMAGTGKRADQRKTLVLNAFGNDYFRKDIALRRGTRKPKLKVINLDFISKNLSSLEKKNKGSSEIDLTGFKILGEGELNKKLKIKASAASLSALEKVKKHGGEIILPNNKESKE